MLEVIVNLVKGACSQEAIAKFVTDVQQVANNVRNFCSNKDEFLMNLIAHFQLAVKDIVQMVDNFRNRQWQLLGRHFGELLKITVLHVGDLSVHGEATGEGDHHNQENQGNRGTNTDVNTDSIDATRGSISSNTSKSPQNSYRGQPQSTETETQTDSPRISDDE